MLIQCQNHIAEVNIEEKKPEKVNLAALLESEKKAIKLVTVVTGKLILP